MDPYYSHMHTYGPVPEGQGVDRNMNQLYGRKSLGQAGLGSAGSNAVALGVIGAAVVGMYVVDGLLTGYIIGSKDSKRTIARRSAIVGALVGIPTYGLLIATRPV